MSDDDLDWDADFDFGVGEEVLKKGNATLNAPPVVLSGVAANPDEEENWDDDFDLDDNVGNKGNTALGRTPAKPSKIIDMSVLNQAPQVTNPATERADKLFAALMTTLKKLDSLLEFLPKKPVSSPPKTPTRLRRVETIDLYSTPDRIMRMNSHTDTKESHNNDEEVWKAECAKLEAELDSAMSRDEPVAQANFAWQLGMKYKSHGAAIDAMTHFETAKDILEKIDDDFLIEELAFTNATLQYQMGLTARILQDIVQAQVFFKDAIKSSLALNDRNVLIDSYLEMGYCLFKLEQWLQALDYYNSFLFEFTSVSFGGFEGEQSKQNSSKFAPENKNGKNPKITRGDYESLAHVCYNIAVCAKNLHQPVLAGKYCRKCIALSDGHFQFLEQKSSLLLTMIAHAGRIGTNDSNLAGDSGANGPLQSKKQSNENSLDLDWNSDSDVDNTSTSPIPSSMKLPKVQAIQKQDFGQKTTGSGQKSTGTSTTSQSSSTSPLKQASPFNTAPNKSGVAVPSVSMIKEDDDIDSDEDWANDIGDSDASSITTSTKLQPFSSPSKSSSKAIGTPDDSDDDWANDIDDTPTTVDGKSVLKTQLFLPENNETNINEVAPFKLLPEKDVNIVTVIYPKPSTLFSMKTTTGHNLLSETDLDTWLQTLISKYRGDLLSWKESQMELQALRDTFSVKMKELKPMSREWCTEIVGHCHQLCSQNQTKECWKYIMEYFDQLKIYFNTHKSLIGSRLTSTMQLTFTASRLWTPDCDADFLKICKIVSKCGPHYSITSKIIIAETMAHHQSGKSVLMESLTEAYTEAKKEYDLLISKETTHLSGSDGLQSSPSLSSISSKSSKSSKNQESKKYHLLLMQARALTDINLFFLDRSMLTTQLQPAFDDSSDDDDGKDTYLCDDNLRMSLLLELYPQLESSFDKAKAALALGLSSMIMEEFEQAERLLFECVYMLDTMPTSVPGLRPLVSEMGASALAAYGKVLVDNYKYKYSVPAIDGALLLCDMRGRVADYYTLLRKAAKSAQQQGDLPRAIDLYTEIVDHYRAENRLNEAVYVYEILCGMHLENGSFQQAITCLQRATESLPDYNRFFDETTPKNTSFDPGFLRLQLQTAKILLASYHWDKSIDLLEQMVRFRQPVPFMVATYELLARAFIKKRAFSEADSWLETWRDYQREQLKDGQFLSRRFSISAQNTNMTYDVAYYALKAKNYFFANKFAEALQYIDKAIIFSSASRLASLGKHYFFRGRILRRLCRFASTLTFPTTLKPSKTTSLFYEQSHSSGVQTPNLQSAMNNVQGMQQAGQTAGIVDGDTPSHTYERPSDLLQECIQTYRQAYNYFKLTGDDCRIAKAVSDMAEAYLEYLFWPVASSEATFEDLASSPLFKYSFIAQNLREEQRLNVIMLRASGMIPHTSSTSPSSSTLQTPSPHTSHLNESSDDHPKSRISVDKSKTTNASITNSTSTHSLSTASPSQIHASSSDAGPSSNPPSLKLTVATSHLSGKTSPGHKRVQSAVVPPSPSLEHHGSAGTLSVGGTNPSSLSPSPSGSPRELTPDPSSERLPGSITSSAASSHASSGLMGPPPPRPPSNATSTSSTHGSSHVSSHTSHSHRHKSDKSMKKKNSTTRVFPLNLGMSKSDKDKDKLKDSSSSSKKKDRRISSSQTTDSDEEEANGASGTLANQSFVISLKTIENASKLALEIAAYTGNILLALNGYLNMAEVRYLEGKVDVATNFWFECIEQLNNFFMNGNSFILNEAPPSFLQKMFIIVKRAVRFMFFMPKTLINRNLSLVDIFLNLENDLEQQLKKAVGSQAFSTYMGQDASLPRTLFSMKLQKKFRSERAQSFSQVSPPSGLNLSSISLKDHHSSREAHQSARESNYSNKENPLATSTAATGSSASLNSLNSSNSSISSSSSSISSSPASRHVGEPHYSTISSLNSSQAFKSASNSSTNTQNLNAQNPANIDDNSISKDNASLIWGYSYYLRQQQKKYGEGKLTREELKVRSTKSLKFILRLASVARSQENEYIKEVNKKLNSVITRKSSRMLLSHTPLKRSLTMNLSKETSIIDPSKSSSDTPLSQNPRASIISSAHSGTDRERSDSTSQSHKNPSFEEIVSNRNEKLAKLVYVLQLDDRLIQYVPITGKRCVQRIGKKDEFMNETVTPRQLPDHVFIKIHLLDMREDYVILAVPTDMCLNQVIEYLLNRENWNDEVAPQANLTEASKRSKPGFFSSLLSGMGSSSNTGNYLSLPHDRIEKIEKSVRFYDEFRHLLALIGDEMDPNSTTQASPNSTQLGSGSFFSYIQQQQQQQDSKDGKGSTKSRSGSIAESSATRSRSGSTTNNNNTHATHATHDATTRTRSGSTNSESKPSTNTSNRSERSSSISDNQKPPSLKTISERQKNDKHDSKDHKHDSKDHKHDSKDHKHDSKDHKSLSKQDSSKLPSTPTKSSKNTATSSSSSSLGDHSKDQSTPRTRHSDEIGAQGTPPNHNNNNNSNMSISSLSLTTKSPTRPQSVPISLITLAKRKEFKSTSTGAHNQYGNLLPLRSKLHKKIYESFSARELSKNSPSRPLNVFLYLSARVARSGAFNASAANTIHFSEEVAAYLRGISGSSVERETAQLDQVLLELQQLFAPLIDILPLGRRRTDPTYNLMKCESNLYWKAFMGDLSDRSPILTSTQDAHDTGSGGIVTRCPLSLICSKYMHVIPWELFLPAETILRYFALEDAAAKPTKMPVKHSNSRRHKKKISLNFLQCYYSQGYRHIQQQEAIRRSWIRQNVDNHLNLTVERYAPDYTGDNSPLFPFHSIAIRNPKKISHYRSKYKHINFVDMWTYFLKPEDIVKMTEGLETPIVILSYADLLEISTTLLSLIRSRTAPTFVFVPESKLKDVISKLGKMVSAVAKTENANSEDAYQFLMTCIISVSVELAVPIVCVNPPAL